MAVDTVDAVLEVLGNATPRHVQRRSRTRGLHLRGADGYEATRTTAVTGLTAEQVEHLAGRYGGEAPVVFAMVERDAALAQPLVSGLPYLRAEALHAARYEMVTTLDDVLSRRTRARILAAEASMAAAEEVADLVGDELGWDAERRRHEVDTYVESVTAELVAAGLADAAETGP